MFERLATQVPLFRDDVPSAARAAVILFILVWFLELNIFLPLILTAFQIFSGNDRQMVGGVFLMILTGAWQILNATLIVALAYQKNWARVLELVLTSFGILLCAVWLILKQNFHPGPLYLCNAVATALLLVPSARAWFLRSTVTGDR